ncbi:hypothetical protein HCC45_11070 [Streptococcus suis]|nr:hypothetical protein [Streptococcus suis]
MSHKSCHYLYQYSNHFCRQTRCYSKKTAIKLIFLVNIVNVDWETAGSDLDDSEISFNNLFEVA